MESVRKLTRFIAWPVVIVLQLIATQIVTLLISFLLGDMEAFPEKNPVLFIIILGLTYSLGIFLVGWFAIKLHWLGQKPKFLERFSGTLIGAYLLLIIGLVVSGGFGPDNLFFILGSPLAGILGFYLAGWIGK